MKSVAFVGIGGVGGYYGAMVARRCMEEDGGRVVFVARGENLRAIRERGLRVHAVDEEFTARPTLATDRVDEAGIMDLVIFAVKGYALEKAAKDAVPLVGQETVVLPLLNGVDNGDTLSRILSCGHVGNGCVYISARREEPGVIRQTGGSRKLFFGPLSGDRTPFLAAERFLRRCGIDATLVDPIDEAVWTKFIFMSPMAGVTSLWGKTFGEVLAGEESLSMAEGMMREIRTLAEEKRIALPEDIVEQSLAKARAFPPDTKSSMQLDCEKRSPTEIESFLGYVVREGDRLGLDVHLTRGVYDALKLHPDQPWVSEQEGHRP